MTEQPPEAPRITLHRDAESNGAILVISGRIARDDIHEVCLRARELLDHEKQGPILCDVRGLVAPDAAAVETLARLRLMARRSGRRMYVSRCNGELRELLHLMGLRRILGGLGSLVW